MASAAIVLSAGFNLTDAKKIEQELTEETEETEGYGIFGAYFNPALSLALAQWGERVPNNRLTTSHKGTQRGN